MLKYLTKHCRIISLQNKSATCCSDEYSSVKASIGLDDIKVLAKPHSDVQSIDTALETF